MDDNDGLGQNELVEIVFEGIKHLISEMTDDKLREIPSGMLAVYQAQKSENVHAMKVYATGFDIYEGDKTPTMESLVKAVHKIIKIQDANDLDDPIMTVAIVDAWRVSPSDTDDPEETMRKVEEIRAKGGRLGEMEEAVDSVEIVFAIPSDDKRLIFYRAMIDLERDEDGRYSKIAKVIDPMPVSKPGLTISFFAACAYWMVKLVFEALSEKSGAEVKKFMVDFSERIANMDANDIVGSHYDLLRDMLSEADIEPPASKDDKEDDIDLLQWIN